MSSIKVSNAAEENTKYNGIYEKVEEPNDFIKTLMDENPGKVYENVWLKDDHLAIYRLDTDHLSNKIRKAWFMADLKEHEEDYVNHREPESTEPPTEKWILKKNDKVFWSEVSLECF